MLKTCFLYFYELVGIKESDTDSIEILMAHLTAKTSTIKEKEIPKTKLDKISFNLDAFTFTSTKGGKLSSAHLR